MNDINVYKEFSNHFWEETLKKSENFFNNIPKRYSTTISFNKNTGVNIKTDPLKIENIENILMRLRIFLLNNSNLNINRILNLTSKNYPFLREDIRIIKENLKKIEKKEISMVVEINNVKYIKIYEIIGYLWNGMLLHDDLDKKNIIKHYLNKINLFEILFIQI